MPPPLILSMIAAQRAQGGRVTSAAITRKESEYSPTRGTPEHHCGPVRGWKHDCAFFVKGGTCTKVGGSIAPKGGCNWFSDKVANRAEGGAIDDETANAYRYWLNEDPEAPPPTALARKGVYVKTGDLAEGPSTNIEDRSQEPSHAPEMTKKEWAQANVYGNQLFDRNMLDEMSSDPVTRYRMRESLGYNDLNKFNKHRAGGGRINHDPSEAQKEAGNYKKGHVKVHGLDISIENEKGSTRSGVGKDGKAWKCIMKADYGYIRSLK